LSSSTINLNDPLDGIGQGVSVRTRYKLAILFVISLLLIVMHLTSAWYLVLGHLRNESFYEGWPVTYWASELDSSDERRRGRAAYALDKLGRSAEPAVGPLSDALQRTARTDREYKFRFAVLNTLRQIGPAAEATVPSLIQVIDDPNPFAKWGAIYALKAIGPGASAALPALRRAAQDPVPLTRVISAQAIWAISGDKGFCIAALTSVIEGSDPQAHLSALHTLSEIEPTAPVLTPAIIKILEDDKQSASNLSMAASLMAERSPESRQAISALQGLRNHDDQRVRQAAATALSRIEEGKSNAENQDTPVARP